MKAELRHAPGVPMTGRFGEFIEKLLPTNMTGGWSELGQMVDDARRVTTRDLGTPVLQRTVVSPAVRELSGPVGAPAAEMF